MPRPTGLRPVLLALALLPLPLGACSSHGGTDAGAPVEDRSPVPAPAGHLGDIFLPTPGATWSKARGSLGQAALFLPQSFGALAATLVGLPVTLSAELDEAVPVIGAAARQGQRPPQVALGLHLKAGDRFVDMVTKGEGARFKSAVDPTTHVTLLTDKTSPESSRFALGVLGNYLLVAPRARRSLCPRALRGPHARPRAGADGRRGHRAPRGGARRPAPRPGARDAQPGRGRRRHARPAREPARHRASRCSATPRTRASPSTSTRRAPPRPPHRHAQARRRPASKLVADLAVGDVKPLLDLPDTTTLGLLWRESAAARAENAPKQADALVGLLGERRDAEDERRPSPPRSAPRPRRAATGRRSASRSTAPAPRRWCAPPSPTPTA